jgi:hypothetical protein
MKIISNTEPQITQTQSSGSSSPNLTRPDDRTRQAIQGVVMNMDMNNQNTLARRVSQRSFTLVSLSIKLPSLKTLNHMVGKSISDFRKIVSHAMDKLQCVCRPAADEVDPLALLQDVVRQRERRPVASRQIRLPNGIYLNRTRLEVIAEEPEVSTPRSTPSIKSPMPEQNKAGAHSSPSTPEIESPPPEQNNAGAHSSPSTSGNKSPSVDDSPNSPSPDSSSPDSSSPDSPDSPEFKMVPGIRKPLYHRRNVKGLRRVELEPIVEKIEVETPTETPKPKVRLSERIGNLFVHRTKKQEPVEVKTDLQIEQEILEGREQMQEEIRATDYRLPPQAPNPEESRFFDNPKAHSHKLADLFAKEDRDAAMAAIDEKVMESLPKVKLRSNKPE